MTKYSKEESSLMQKEAEELYRKYNIELREYVEQDESSVPTIEYTKNNVRTIKLSNSTTPMACL